jgi:hypothetical protein
MSDQAATLGIPDTFVFDGITFKVSEITFEIEGMFSRWVASEARAAIERHKSDMAPAEYEIQLTGWRNDGAAHVYDYEGYTCARARFSPSGRRYLAYLCLARLNGNNVTQDLIDDIWHAKAETPESTPPFIELELIIDRLNADPNRARPRRHKPGPR